MKFMKWLLILCMPLNLFSAAFTYKGDWRSEIALFHQLDLSKGRHGTVSDYYITDGMDLAANDTKTYWLQRFKLKPELIVDDNLRLKSEWFLLAGSASGATIMSLGTDNVAAGSIAGSDNVNAAIGLRRMWMEWISDWGILTVGRQPFHYGLGMAFNAGDGLWDYYGTSVDRIAYDLRMGSMYIKTAFDILSEGAVNYAVDDKNGFLMEVGYIKPDVNMEMALLWYMDYGAHKNKIHTYDVYQKKSYPQYDLDLGWEIAYRKGLQDDTEGGTWTGRDKVIAFGFVFEFEWSPAISKLGFKTGFASGDDDAGNNEYYGFAFSPAYSVAMLLFNEDLGIGGDSVHASDGIGSDFEHLGAFYISPYYNITLGEVFRMGTNITYARTHRSKGRSKVLGTELDLDFAYIWKENFETGLKFGLFFPSAYFTGRTSGFGTMLTLGFSF